ncbi:MAG TPA: class I SAM-dependent methyltransferase [Ktedonobacteraceae bacterium]|nr:class I SAM-dependent methyltransferase [Ktedonobacteraceae bacterium]
MSSPPNPRREHPSTYFVQDRSNQDELTRLQLQDESTTLAMGGTLPEQSDPERFQRILDIGCGTGNWLLEVAQTYPTISLLVGVDISGRMIEYAQSQALARGLDKRVQFHTMDVLRVLEFPNHFFDLVNQRFATSYLRTWDWPRLMQEYQRILRFGGILRLTEGDFAMEGTSPALVQLIDLLRDAFAQAGHFFDVHSNGIATDLVHVLTRYGFHDIQSREYNQVVRAGTSQGDHLVEDMRLAFRTTVPFLRKWSNLPDNYEAIYQQMVNETQQPNFATTGLMITAWGRKPPKEENL